jgi:hypothetical protein
MTSTDGSMPEPIDSSMPQGPDASITEGSADVGTSDGAGDAQTDANTCLLSVDAPTGKYVINKITLPTSKSQFAYDINGDGKLDNGYGNTDPAFTTAACARAKMTHGLWSRPGEAGSVLSVDTTRGVCYLIGNIAAAIMQGDIGRPPNPSTIDISYLFGPSAIPITPVHISFKYDATTGLTMGQLNGFISVTDLTTKAIPRFAATLTASVGADPGSNRAQQLLAIFDTGGTADATCSGTCKNPTGDCAVAGDMIISACEVGSNQLIKNIFAPDVQMFSSDGGMVFDPSPANTTKDSLSIGFGFTAVPATY